MAGETVITVVGNLTADPELRYTQNGLAVANFTIASTPRTFDRQANEWKDGDALFLRASVWREFAEHVAGSLTKGSRVIAQGRLRQRSYQDREGQQRTSIEPRGRRDRPLAAVRDRPDHPRAGWQRRWRWTRPGRWRRRGQLRWRQRRWLEQRRRRAV